MKVIVASKNPIKIQAARGAFERMFPDASATYEGFSVSSGVPDQPHTEEETLQGAVNRATRARAEYPDADYWVGMEGGVVFNGDAALALAWIAVLGRDGMVGRGRTGTFYLPPEVGELVRAGHELGEADDIVFGRENSKQQNGAIGLLTGDVLTRTQHYSDATVLALIPFKNRALYLV
ncbi:inosine/xanthosine triphosphatase [Candidatus Uhrbacteria bacterium]|nr:inosine/xanthosine triphosphatase [Candidatus Uhrbacteria bacterium]